MKKFYATEDSAIQLIRLGLFPRNYAAYAFVPPDILDAACRARDIKSLAATSDTISMLSTPYTVLIPEHTQRRASKLVTCRTLSAEIKEPYLVGIDDDCLCVIPELLFALYCQRHDLASSVRLGLELCGTYTCPAFSNHMCFTSYDLSKLTDVASIRGFLSRNPGIYGARRATRYARYVQDGSASPMETNLFLLLCLPTSEGGYSLPLPELNADLPIIQYLGSKHVPGIRYGDLVFQSAHVVLEYQSIEHHSDPDKIEADEDRRDDIEASGYTVMFITPARIKDFDRFEAVAQRLAHYLDIDFSQCAPGRTDERIALRKKLLPASWNV